MYFMFNEIINLKQIIDLEIFIKIFFKELNEILHFSLYQFGTYDNNKKVLCIPGNVNCNPIMKHKVPWI